MSRLIVIISLAVCRIIMEMHAQECLPGCGWCVSGGLGSQTEEQEESKHEAGSIGTPPGLGCAYPSSNRAFGSLRPYNMYCVHIEISENVNLQPGGSP